MNGRIPKYDEFWLYYLREHSRPASRALHYLGTVCSMGAIVAGAIVSPWWLLAAPVLGYGPAWIGHFVIEKNRPATFRYPLWSLISDYKMFGLAIIGRLGPELARATQAAPVSAPQLSQAT
jgi:hypothetical protein